MILRKGAAELGGDVQSEEALNEMLARSEEEFKVFEEMDQVIELCFMTVASRR